MTWKNQRVSAKPWVLLFLTATACSDHSEDDVRTQVAILLAQEGSSAPVAAERLAKKGRAAIPIIESALHTATPVGKKNLILALRKIADPQAVPLLGHLAAHDPLPDVRREAEWTLKQWAATGSATGNDELAQKSREALRALDESKGTEEAG